MHISIHGKNNLVITSSVNEHIKKQLERIKRHYINNILHLNISLDQVKKNHIVDVTLTVSQHHFHQKNMSSTSMHEAIDLVFDKLDRQVRRYKDVLKSHQVDKKVIHALHQEATQKELRSIVHQQEVENIIIDKKPISLSEAILQMELVKNQKGMGFYLADAPNLIEKSNNSKKLMLKSNLDKPSFLYANGKGKKTFKLFHYCRQEIKSGKPTDKINESIPQKTQIGFWEEILLEWHKNKKLQVLSVDIIKMPSEFLEDSLEYLLLSKEEYRLLHSLRAGREMLLLPGKKIWQLWHIA